ncbi:MAG TPA: hypothetical protein VLU94_02230, partial [Candidatus Nitrosotalea sp.]|nr:hypothetical protein [Candidatus Nitrosotalea sp.]
PLRNTKEFQILAPAAARRAALRECSGLFGNPPCWYARSCCQKFDASRVSPRILGTDEAVPSSPGRDARGGRAPKTS